MVTFTSLHSQNFNHVEEHHNFYYNYCLLPLSYWLYIKLFAAMGRRCITVTKENDVHNLRKLLVDCVCDNRDCACLCAACGCWILIGGIYRHPLKVEVPLIWKRYTYVRSTFCNSDSFFPIMVVCFSFLFSFCFDHVHFFLNYA